MRKNICITVISSKEQNLNKQMAEFRISILFQYSMYILAKFNIFSWSWKLISKLNTFNTAWELCDTFTTAAYWNTFARCRQDKAHDNNYTGKSIENTVKNAMHHWKETTARQESNFITDLHHEDKCENKLTLHL